MSRFDPHRYALACSESGDVASDGQLLYRWRGTHWSALTDEQCLKEAYHWLVEHDRLHTSAENARKAFRAAVLYATSLPESTQHLVIPCQNGYIRLAHGQLDLLPPDRTLGLQHVLTCPYLPENGKGFSFLEFLDRILPDPAVQARVQEYVGYTLTADARYQRAQLWLGGGANGKGVLANVVQALHGVIAAVSLEKLEGFNLSVLVGASLIYADEVPRSRINEQLLKSMIAGERVQVNRKYLDPLSLHIRGKWLVLGNHLPAVTDHSAGFWRRWDIVPFQVTIPEVERNPLLAEQLIRDELSSILNWAIEGLIRLESRGRFDPVLPGPMQAVLHEAKSETNSVLAWVEDVAVNVQGEPCTPKDAVYQHYRDWCGSNGLTPMAAPRFWPRLKDVLAYQEERRRCHGRQVRVCNVQVPGQL